MPGTVILTVTTGPAAGVEYVYAERAHCVVGRAEDCSPRLVESGHTPWVSRHHCLFDINPPAVRVRDFGSLNGTHVNGVEIGRRFPGQTPEQGARLEFRERDLVDGDEVRLGEVVLRVGVRPESGSEPTDPLVRPAADLGWLSRYEPIRELGRGAQGVVYLVRTHDSGELAALKVLSAQVAVEPRAAQGFLREMDALRALRHPNIVGFHEGGAAGALFYLACEYCAGGSLERLVRERGPLDAEQAVRLTAQALDALDYAHHATLDAQTGDAAAVGVVHRDVKPANILLSGPDSHRIAKLADFGLAKAFDRAGLSGLTMTGSVAGSVAFMSRVQLVDYKFVRPEVDVWATAATLYFMLTGVPPREFPHGVDPITIVLRDNAVPVRHREPAVPAALAAVIDEALVDNPRIRITSAAELRRALMSAL
ncbi:protein kinase [Nocardia sp. 2]|uniref:non-specific serine/threonine protein kinase n=1 Tax=Nocardia acididurans TaxID=2802282 RepID=A0ABS1M0R1_9NOCA|nr:protein kinase [Nocardia acididurans]MBL1074252.1 protein kinase [Nocardia acididurans]